MTNINGDIDTNSYRYTVTYLKNDSQDTWMYSCIVDLHTNSRIDTTDEQLQLTLVDYKNLLNDDYKIYMSELANFLNI